MNPILPDDLAVFLQTVQCGSFSAAARALNVAPKAASKQVARLEAALGVALFTRNTRNLRLTDEGEALRDKARSVLDGLAEMSELAQGADGMRGMIRLTAPAPFGRKYVAAAVADFSRRYPQVGFSLCLSDEVCNLFAGNFDLAIRMGELADSRLIARRIAVNRRILVASPAYLAEYGCPQSPAELSEHRCLRFAYPGLAADSWTLRNGDAEAVVRVSPHLSSDSGEVLHAWCMAGLGISLRETWDVCEALENGSLRRVLPDWQTPPGGISIVRVRREPTPQRILRFSEFLIARWQKAPWERAG